MFASRALITTAAVGVAVAFFLSGCGGSSGGSSAIPQTASQQQAGKAAPKAASCTLIDTVNPKSDFAGLGFTAAVLTGGDHLNIDATGCTYGIYLYPGAPNLNIDHAYVNNASRIQIFAEDVSGVTINHTVVNGTNFGRSPSPNSISGGGIAFRGASGTVNHTRIYNTRVLGMNIVNTSACSPGQGNGEPCIQSNVTVDDTTIDNSLTTGDGFDVIGGPLPAVAVANISRSTVIGGNLATPPGKSEIDADGAQTGFAFFDASIKTANDSSINNQVGFDVYCSTGIANLADLTSQRDKVTFATTVSLTTPLAENQVLNVFSAAQLAPVFGPSPC